MSRPKLLDLFCGQGGAARGYQGAGFDVTGVDRTDHSRRYPGRFIQGDALAYLAQHGAEYDVIHASPPCQGYSIATAGNARARGLHQRMIPATRELLKLAGRPWVIENVEQARSQMVNPIMLCGSAFQLCALDLDGEPLELRRHRLFESSEPLEGVACDHGWFSRQVAGVYGGSRRAPGAAAPAEDRHAARHDRGGGYVPRSKRVAEELMGIDWMTWKGLHESIPPAYTECLGGQLITHVQEAAA